MPAHALTRRRLQPVLLLLAAASAASALAAAEPSPPVDQLEIGRRIYQEGLLPGGAPLAGQRLGGTPVSGSAAACASCHRRSGMGSVEGDILIPPITGNYLFGGGSKNMATMDPRRGKAMNQAHQPYTVETLGRAVRHGENVGGRPMNEAMPRYRLTDAELGALAAYLGQLSPQWSPGVTAGSIRFATVIAPGVEPAKRQALIDTMRKVVQQKNGSTLPGRRHMVSPAEMLSRTERSWALDLWQLEGPPETWAAQLDGFYRRAPVFALVSGLANGTWQPVHDFCEREKVPCWFPSVELPPAAPGRYPLYFSRGVALEADVLAKHLVSQGGERPRRLVQIYRNDEAGRGAARALEQALAGSGIAAEGRILDSDGDPRQLLVGTAPTDALMFWLRPEDLVRLEPPRPGSGPAYFSGTLGGAEHTPLPAAWKEKARLVYPFELPDQRQANLAYFHEWLRLRDLPLVDEKLQSEAYFALSFLTDTVSEMLDNLYRDYLVERAENMLSRREGSRVEQESRERVLLGWKGRSFGGRPAVVRETEASQEQGGAGRFAAAAPGSHESTTIYPRLGLGPDQRFASKGGYIVRFAAGQGERLIAESDWIVP